MSVFKKLKDDIADLSELSVQTFTGDIKSVVDSSSDGNVINWANLLKNAKSTGEVTLVASTNIEFDGDSNTYYEQNIDPTLLAAHKAAVQSAQEYRQGLLNLFKDVLNIK